MTRSVTQKPEAAFDSAQRPMGEVIRTWREQQQLSVTELARKADLTKSYVSLLEHNKIRRPNREHLMKLANALEVPLWKLLARQLPDELVVEPRTGHIARNLPAHPFDPHSIDLAAEFEALPGWQAMEFLQATQRQLEELTAEVKDMKRLLPQRAPILKEPVSHWQKEFNVLVAVDSNSKVLEQVQDFLDQNREASRGERTRRLSPRFTLRSLTSELPTESILISGVENVVRTAIQLLAAAQQLPAAHADQILLTFQGKRDIFDVAPEFQEQWWHGLKTALDRGWDVIQLVRILPDSQRLHRFVLRMLRMLGSSGSYLPHYFHQNVEEYFPALDFLIVPHVGALQFIPTQQGDYIDSAFFFAGEDALQTLSNHVARLRAQYTPVFTRFPHLSPEFDTALTLTEKQPGERALVKNGLSAIIVPVSLEKERARPFLERGGDPATLLRLWLAHSEQRQNAFLENLRSWHYRDICPKSAIVSLVKTGRYAKDDRLLAMDGPAFNTDQTVQLLQHMIKLLEVYPNYELGLLDKRYERLVQTFWEVKGDQTVILEHWHRDLQDQLEEEDLQITEPFIAGAFRTTFDKLWQKTTCDKAEVIAWLKEQAAQVSKVRRE